MDIYFAASIRGSGGIDPETCRKFIEHLRRHGRVFTEHICEAVVKKDFDEGTDREIHERDVRWLNSANAVVAEVSVPSLGVGYEIGKAEEWGKEILCLYSAEAPGRLSAMIQGNDCITLRRYGDVEEALAFIDEFLSRLS